MRNFFEVIVTEELVDRMLSIVNGAFDAVSDGCFDVLVRMHFLLGIRRHAYTRVIRDIITAVFWKPGSKTRNPFLTLFETSDSSSAHIC